MSTLPRQFRGPESHAAEIKSRDTVAPFLISRGYQVLDDQRIKTGMATQQFIVARAPDGQNLKTRIRLCWRRDGRNSNEQKYSAAQLAAHLRPGGWDATLEHMVERDIAIGRGLSLHVVAEGIEHATQCEILKAQGYKVGQGNYFSVPLSCRDFEQWFIAYNLD